MHVFDRRFLAAPTAFFAPPHAPVADYLEVQAALGLSRVVVVQTSVYAFDNACMLEAMAAFGPGARGVAVVPVEVTEAELARLTAAGVRGVRFFMLRGGVLPWEALEPLADKIRPFGWHVQLQLDGRELPKHEARLRSLPVELVIDHNGKFLEPVPPADPAFRSLRRLLDTGRCWVKLSAPYETSRTGPPRFEDVSVLARELARCHPDRCLWASNWPHPNRNPVPADADMLALLTAWADGDTRLRDRVLVDNPAALYGF